MRKGSVKKHLNIHKRRLVAAAAAALAVIALLAGIPAMQARAEFDTDTAVRFRIYKQSHTIEDSVLFIGTHLIHLQAMTDELYEKAVQSQSDSEQEAVYYKSELADGTWFDITDAAGLSDIMSAGIQVSESDLDDLYVTCYTGSDGVTKSAKTDEAVCIFDDPDPYDLLQLKELEIIREIRSQSYSEEGEGPHKYLYQALNAFFASDVQNDATRECDRVMENLQRLYEAYCAADLDEDAQVITSLMDSVDAARRAEVYAQLCEDGEPQTVTGEDGVAYTIQSNSLLTELTRTVSGDYYDENSETYDGKAFQLDSTLLDAVVTSIGECGTSYTSYASKALSPGETTIRSYIYGQMRALVDLCGDAESISITGEITEIVNNIKYAQNIENGVVGDADAEARLLDEHFIPTEEEAYTEALQAGAPAEYTAAVSANKSDTAKQAILKNASTGLDTARSALETMISAKKERMSSSDAVSYIYGRITWISEQEKKIPNDDFAVCAKQSAADHLEWLTDLAKKIADKDASLMSELDRLKELLAGYLTKQQEALDDGNLELAAQYGLLAEDASEKLAAEEAGLNEILNSDTASAADKAAAQVALGQTGLLNDINDLKNDAVSAINNGETDGLQNMLDLLATLGGEHALNDIKAALAASSLSSSEKNKWTEKLDAAIESSRDSSLYDKANATTAADGSGSETGSGSGTGTSDTNPATMSEKALLHAIEQILGGSFDELDAEGRAAAVTALDRIYDEFGNVNAKALAEQFALKCLSQKSPYIFTQLRGHPEAEYLPLSTIGNKSISPYRYVYSDSRQEATMTYKAESYRFSVGAKVVTLTDGTQQEIKKYKVEFQNTPYIDENTAKTYFGCEAEYIAGTAYGVCLTGEAKEKADELYNALAGQP